VRESQPELDLVGDERSVLAALANDKTDPIIATEAGSFSSAREVLKSNRLRRDLALDQESSLILYLASKQSGEKPLILQFFSVGPSRRVDDM
jgi:hypothetical protein